MKPCRIIRKFRQILTLVTCGDVNADLNEKIPMYLVNGFFHELPNAFFRFSLRRVAQESG